MVIGKWRNGIDRTHDMFAMKIPFGQPRHTVKFQVVYRCDGLTDDRSIGHLKRKANETGPIR